MLTKERGAVLLDLGFVGDDTVVGDERRVGRPDYTAPEARGSNPDYHKNDVYGWGATIYYAITGEDPPLGDALVEEQKVVLQRIVSVSELAELLNSGEVGLDRDFDWILEGEVANLVEPASGHTYFDLVETQDEEGEPRRGQARIGVSLFKKVKDRIVQGESAGSSDLAPLGHSSSLDELREGNRVIVHGPLQFYAPGGRLAVLMDDLLVRRSALSSSEYSDINPELIEMVYEALSENPADRPAPATLARRLKPLTRTPRKTTSD
jgi:serine/threonine protein kinase